jgi:hypothetical protein
MANLDQVLKLTPNRAYPSLPTINPDSQSLVQAMNLVKEAHQIYERRTNDIANSFVRVQDLLDLGLVTLEGLQVSNSVSIRDVASLGGGAVATLGTVGGVGPAAAAQASWTRVRIGGVNYWIPVWV